MPHDDARLRPAAVARGDGRARRLTGYALTIDDHQPVPTVPPPDGPPPGVTGPPPARRRLLVVELLVMAFLAAVPSFVLSLQGIDDPAEIDLEVSSLELVASLLAALGPAAMAAYLLWRDGRLLPAGFGRRPFGFVAGYGALGWVCCFIAIVSVGLLINTVIIATGGEITEAQGLDFELTVGTFVAALALSVVAGVGEEIVFRAYAISRMEEAGYARAARWLPWLVFTVVHLYQGPLALLYIGAVGGVFTWLYLWRRSVWPCVVAHFLYDATILLVAATTG